MSVRAALTVGRCFANYRGSADCVQRRVDLDRKVAWLDHGTTKSGDGRATPLNADAVAALEATRGQHLRWCFTFGGKRIQQSSTA
jgi:hypothetical protein